MRAEITREFLESVMRAKQAQRVKQRLKENETWAFLPNKIEMLKQELDDWGYDLSDSDNTPKKNDDEAAWDILQSYKQAKFQLKTNKPKDQIYINVDGSIEEDYLTLEAILSGLVNVDWLNDNDNWNFYTKHNGRHMLWHNLLNNYKEYITELEETQ
jgi:hypothetical protein